MSGTEQDLAALGNMQDGAIDLADAALTLAALEHPGTSPGPYRQFLADLGAELIGHHRRRLAGGVEDTLPNRLESLRHIFMTHHGFKAPPEQYDDLRNADLMDVIDRRQGMPIVLCILYIDAGRRAGWRINGINLPGHFVARLEDGAERLIFDPFDGGRILQAHDLRQIVKATIGPDAELSATYFEPASNRSILLRLQNNIKLRLIASGAFERALSIVARMRAIDPGEPRLLFDEGVLLARTGQSLAAIEALERYLPVAPAQRDRNDAAMLLQHIRGTLN